MSILTQILPKKETTNYFIVLGLEEHHVRAAVAEITGNKVKILGTGKSEFADEGNELEAVDIAVSTAEKQISEKLLVENVIFALPQFYLEGENVKPEYQARLKKIAKELELKAYGFVEYSSAIANFITASEGSPPTVILMDLSKNHMTTTLVRIGKVVQNVITDRSDSLVADFSKSLPEFEAEILPSRIVIFDFSQRTEEVKEELLKFPWHKYNVFLHTPKIEVFNNEKILTAIVEAAASSFLPNIGPTETVEEERQAPKEIIEEEKEAKEEKAEKAELPTITQSPKKFGFSEVSLSEKAANLKKETAPINRGPEPMDKVKGILSGVTGKINLSGLSGIKMPAIPGKQIGGLLYILPFIVFALILFYLVRSYPTASVYLITYPQKSDQNISVTFARDASSVTEGVILTRPISEEISGERTGKATGTTQIGDKAKGEVTVYNKQTSSKNAPKGAAIVSGPLKFTLDEDVKIASATESTEGITFGRTSVKATAQAIGPESNLPALSNFTFADGAYSALTAKNNQPFSGGTAREIDSISKEDRDELESELNAELINKGKQKLLTQLNPRGRLLDEPITTVVSAKKFTGEVGSEAKELSLEMTLKVEGLEYNQEDLEKKVNNQGLTVPSGFKLDPGKINVKVAEATTNKNGNIETKVILTSYFIPDIDTGAIKKEIRGKTYNEAQIILEKNSRIGGLKITPEKRLAFFGKRLPFNEANIKVIVTSR